MVVHVVSHPEVQVDPAVPVPQWGLSDAGRARLRRLLEFPWARSAVLVASSAETKALQTARPSPRPAVARCTSTRSWGRTTAAARVSPRPRGSRRSPTPSSSNPGAACAGGRPRPPPSSASCTPWTACSGERGSCPDPARTTSWVVATHGGVGTLLLCALRGIPVDRRHDQPGQGSWYRFDTVTGRVAEGWRRI